MKAKGKLAAVIAAYQQGDRIKARQLVYEILKKEPRNASAWAWACELAETRDEKIHCLEEILLINPADEDARRYLNRLHPMKETIFVPPARPEELKIETPKPAAGAGWIAVLAQIMGVALVIILIAAAVYVLPKSSFLGLRGPDFDSLTISESHEHLESDDYYWQMVFERPDETEFAGLVRHTSPIRIGKLRILTHDILVTSGDYADPNLVNTSVSNHHFRWYTEMPSKPKGAINLLHTVPADEQVYQQLKAIREGDEVTITGREILEIKAYDLQNNYRGNWSDTGCNTLLVTSVTVVQK